MHIESELFEYDGWDGEPECMIFYKVKLKVPIGNYPSGTEFDSATILNGDTHDCILQLSNRDEGHPEATERYCPITTMGEYRLHYRVGETVSEILH
jgi:hypothetical protein